MKSVGLALSGGAVRGAAHIGAVQVLQEHSIPIDYVAGTSAGAFVGAFLAAGRSAAELKTIAGDLSWRAIGSISFGGKGALDDGKMEEFFRRHLREQNIEDLSIPFAAMAANLTSGRLVAIDHGPIFRAVQASTAIPGIFAPVEIDEEIYVDGGALNFDPVEQVRKMGADYVIAIQLLPPQGRIRPPKNVVDVVVSTFDLMTSRMAELEPPGDISIVPDLTDTNSFAFEQLEDLIERGRAAAQTKIDDIREDLRLLSVRETVIGRLHAAKKRLYRALRSRKACDTTSAKPRPTEAG